ncbi:MAG: N-acyl homoserine lactonase family protein [Deltaproteobacteria bacterium]|nr:N-acyl homoserine lactonase family protein [Deltaproteobacteria bacterium]
MAVRLYAFTCGWLTGPLGGFLAGEHGRLRVPIPCYLIDHPRGKVLFDSGLHHDTQIDPAARLGALASVFEVHYAVGEDVKARLEASGVDQGEIRFLVNSHLHFDHAGGNEAIRNAQLVVQRIEWEAGHDADLSAQNHYSRRDYDHGHGTLLIDGEHDLFGDGRVVCIPTYGHTPGHQSLRVRLESGEVVLTGDACYLRRTLEQFHLPSIVYDREAMLESLRRLRALRDAGAHIFYGHDPEFWKSIAQAPVALS